MSAKIKGGEMRAIFKCNNGNEHDFYSNTESEYCARGCGEKWTSYAIKKLSADLKEKDAAVEQLKADIQELKTIIKEMSDHSKGYGHCGMDMFAHTKWRKFADDV